MSRLPRFSDDEYNALLYALGRFNKPVQRITRSLLENLEEAGGEMEKTKQLQANFLRAAISAMGKPSNRTISWATIDVLEIYAETLRKDGQETVPSMLDLMTDIFAERIRARHSYRYPRAARDEVDREQ